MLHHRQEFHMSETHAFDVLRKTGRSLAIGQRTIVFLGNAHPRAEVDFINGLRRAQGISCGALPHPVAISPLIVKVPHHGSGAGRFLVPDPERVGFVDLVLVALRFDMEFVESAFGHVRDEALPDPGLAATLEQMGAGAP
jgi:hypothetical protein